MTGAGGRPVLRLVKGGHDRFRLGEIRVAIRPEIPDGADAVVVEEDTWLVLSSPTNLDPYDVHPIRLFTSLLEAEPSLPGSVLVREGDPVILQAVIYDLDRTPCCAPDGVAAVLEEIFFIAARRRFRSLALPLLGVRHGGLPLPDFVSLLAEAAKKGASGLPAEISLVPFQGAESELRKLLAAAG